jgi:AcrR family transcriptional regulator
LETDVKTTDTQERILDAALELFSRHGFHATTTRRIANKASVNEVTLFRLFKSKMDLFQQVLEIVRSRGFDADRLLAIDLPPAEAIRFVLSAVVETMEENPREFRILQYALLDQVEGFEETFVKKNLQAVVDYLARMIAQLETAPERTRIHKNPHLAAAMMMAQAQGVILGRVQLRHSPLHEYTREELIEMIMRVYILEDRC